jgi:hypothetical protein
MYRVEVQRINHHFPGENNSGHALCISMQGVWLAEPFDKVVANGRLVGRANRTKLTLVHNEGHARLERVEDATDRLPCLLLVHLHFWNKGAVLPVVSALIAWPQNVLSVLSVAWLHGDFNERDPRSLKLILARPSAAGNLAQCHPAQTKVRVRVAVVVRTETVELPLWQDHLVVQNGRNTPHRVARVVVARDQRLGVALHLHALTLDPIYS